MTNFIRFLRLRPQELLAEEPFDKIKRALSGRTGRVLSLITSI